MEVLCVLFIIVTLAFDFVIFIEIEKILDNTFDLGHSISDVNRRLITKRRKK